MDDKRKSGRLTKVSTAGERYLKALSLQNRNPETPDTGHLRDTSVLSVNPSTVH